MPVRQNRIQDSATGL